MLLDRGADVNAQGGDYGNALQAASFQGYEEVVQILLNKGADVNAHGGFYGNSLYAASSRGHEKVVQMLLDKGADVNAEGGWYGNALQAASAEGHEKVVQMLLDKGAELDTRGSLYGNTLEAAFGRGHEPTAQLLLERQADMNTQIGGPYGNALQAAAQAGRPNIVCQLLDRGAHVNTQGGRYGCALQAAAISGNKTTVQMLLDKGACVKQRGGIYGTALQAAARGGHDSIVELLLSYRADVHAQCGLHGNALQAAALGWHSRVIKRLLSAKADVNARGGIHYNALQAAKVYRHEEVLQMLQKWQYQKTISVETSPERPLLDEAAAFCHNCRVFDYSHMFKSERRGFLFLGPVQRNPEKYPCLVCGLVAWMLQKYPRFSEHSSPQSCDEDLVCTLYPSPDRPLFSIFCGPNLRGHLWIVPDGHQNLFVPERCERINKNLELLSYKVDRMGLSLDRPQDPSSDLDLKKISSWLSDCETHRNHKLCQDLSSDKTPHSRLQLMLIDVVESCLVEKDSAAPYFALSYVRGDSQIPDTETKNISKRQKEGYFDSIGHTLPQVIRDAMICVRKMGYRYLWVDALCILQDEGDKKLKQIMQMDAVYSQAFLTLAALSGKSADDGLPGISSGSRFPTRASKVIPNLGNPLPNQGYEAGTSSERNGRTKFHFITESPALDLQADLLPYEKRAWTFQERLLSRRCLYFTSHQTYFHCESAQVSEDEDLLPIYENSSKTFGHLGKNRHAINDLDLPEVQGFNIRRFLQYASLVEQYSQRQLSNPNDILNAFLGIVAVLRHNWGTTFTCGIPSSLFHDALLWFPACDCLVRRKSGERTFPSWSWTGWQGGVQYITEDERYKSGVISFVEFSINKQFPVRPDDVSIEDFSKSKELDQGLSILNGSPGPEKIILYFCTSIVPAERFIMQDGSWPATGTHMLDRNGHVCGVLPFFWFSQKSMPLGQCEFIELSRLEPRLESSAIQVKTSTEIDVFSQEAFGKSTDTWSILNVMLIFRESPNEKAERLALGQIHEQA